MEKDIQILRNLASEWAEIASLPIQRENRRLWKQLNMLRPERPMVNIDQIPWHEMNVNDELTLRCENEWNRAIETELRQKIYKWRHMPCDMPVDGFWRIPPALANYGYSLDPQVTRLQYDDENVTAPSQHFADIVKCREDADKIFAKKAYIDPETQKRTDLKYHEIFDGILPLEKGGLEWMGFALWDFINQVHDIQTSLIELVDDPEFIHYLLAKMRDASLDMIDQCEALGIIQEHPSTIHCTGAYADYDSSSGGEATKNSWVYGMSQIFASVGPDMHEEFEFPYLEPIFKRFGHVYYGCCEPLHNKLGMIRKYSNVRKISMSPWADTEIGAANIGRDYVFSDKPSPAFVARPNMDEDEIRKDLQDTYDACKRNGTPLEFILKDISTVRYQPQRLWKWAEIATEIAKQ